jgi:hypothetical protein
LGRPKPGKFHPNCSKHIPHLLKGIEPVRIEGHRGEHLRLCLQAKKEMGTLRIALRIPVTIATLSPPDPFIKFISINFSLMLVSPLFGDLRAQAFVKLLTLLLQTICFLFLCSIAPSGGFGGSKPKLYTFYEFMFSLTFLSILVCLPFFHFFNFALFEGNYCLFGSLQNEKDSASHSWSIFGSKSILKETISFHCNFTHFRCLIIFFAALNPILPPIINVIWVFTPTPILRCSFIVLFFSQRMVSTKSVPEVVSQTMAPHCNSKMSQFIIKFSELF